MAALTAFAAASIGSHRGLINTRVERREGVREGGMGLNREKSGKEVGKGGETEAGRGRGGKAGKRLFLALPTLPPQGRAQTQRRIPARTGRCC